MCSRKNCFDFEGEKNLYFILYMSIAKAFLFDFLPLAPEKNVCVSSGCENEVHVMNINIGYWKFHNHFFSFRNASAATTVAREKKFPLLK